MAYQSVFKRYELKYLLDKEQKIRVIEAMQPFMEIDSYGKTSIQNIYFDTDDYRLIRHSIEKPLYKEKLRVRSYSSTDEKNQVFVELKKKYKKVVYKRRISMEEETALKWLSGEMYIEEQNQIEKEISYFLSYYKELKPKLFLSYNREAYFGKEESDFRVTFDENVQCREHELSFGSLAGGIGSSNPVLLTAGIGLAVGGATGIMRSIHTAQEQDRSISQKINQAVMQGTSVQGSEDIDILTAYRAYTAENSVLSTGGFSFC